MNGWCNMLSLFWKLLPRLSPQTCPNRALVRDYFLPKYRTVLDLDYSDQRYIRALYWLDNHSKGGTSIKVFSVARIDGLWFVDANGSPRIFVGMSDPDDIINFTLEHMI